MDVETRAARFGSTVAAFGDREQHARAGALRQSRQQGHAQRLDPEEWREHSIASLGSLIGQDADHAAGAQRLEQAAHRCAFGRQLAHIGSTAHPAQKCLSRRMFGAAIQHGDQRACGQPLIEQFPVAVVRRGNDQAAARSERGVERLLPVHGADQALVVALGPRPETQRFACGTCGFAQHRAQQVLARRQIKLRIHDVEIASRHARLTHIQHARQPAECIAQTVQRPQRQASDQRGERVQQQSGDVGDAHASSLNGCR